MRGAPQSAFALLISPMSVRSSAETFGLPTRVAGPPAPIRSKPSTMPANDGLRPDNRNRVKDGWKPAIEPYEQKTIHIAEVRSPRRSPTKHFDLLPQARVSASIVA